MSSLQRRAAVAPPSTDLDAPEQRGGAGLAGVGAVGNAALSAMLSGMGPDEAGRAVFKAGTQGPARPLPFRADLEATFGQDLGHLEVYQGKESSEALSSLDAAGANHDDQILLRPGASFQETVHEVAHGLQEQGPDQGVSQGGEAAEREAHDAVKAAERGEPAIIEEQRGGVNRWGLGDAWNSVKETASNAWNGAKETASNAWNGAKETASNAWDWTRNKAGEAVEGAKSWAIDKGISGLSWLMDRYDDTYKPGLDWARNKVDAGTSWLKGATDKASGWISGGLDALGWQGGANAVRDAGAWVNNKVEDVRETFGLNDKDNSFTHYMEIPANRDGFVQQYSELGIPIASDAWELQDKIDGGKLHRLYNESMLNHLSEIGTLNREDLPQDFSKLSDDEMQHLADKSILPVLQDSGALSALVDSGQLKPEDIPERFSDLDADQITALAEKVRAVGGERGLLDAMDKDDRVAFQEGILDTYMDMANADPNAALLLDLLPTEMKAPMGKDTLLDVAGDALLKGQEPNDFRSGETGLIREGTATMAEQLRAQGQSTYGLVVPYANTAENIVFREGKPTDAAEHIHNYLSKFDTNKTSLINGYSQGGGAVMEYLREHGNKDGLDYAVALAPMGGPTADSTGGDGVWGGQLNGVSTLSIENKRDPAQYIYGDNIKELGPGLLNFVADDKDKKLGGESALHGGFDPEHPELGTYGYPMALGQNLISDLFNGQYTGDYRRRGDWDLDLREFGQHTPEELREMANAYR